MRSAKRKARLKIIYRGEVVRVEEVPAHQKTQRIQYWGAQGFQVEEVRKEEYGRLLRMLQVERNVNLWRMRRGAELI
jgi:hypothetical protein